MTQTLVQRSVETDLGTFDYTPSQLEELTEHLARQWGVELPGLKPEKRFSGLVSNYELLRDGRKEEGNVRVSYFKHGSEELARRALEGLSEPSVKDKLSAQAKALYETDKPEHEYVILKKNGKDVTMWFEPDGKKEVQFIDADAQNALRNAEKAGLGYANTRSNTTMDFARTGSSLVSRHASHEIADTMAAVAVVRLYFGV